MRFPIEFACGGGGDTAREREARLAMAESPETHSLVSNLANALWLEDSLAEALSWARWAVCESVTGAEVHPLAWRCLGNVLCEHGRFAEADRAYCRSDPDRGNADTQFNRSKAQLGLGNWSEAWSLAEQRFQLLPPPTGALPGPHWRGWQNAKHIHLWSEQGFGDTLQFLRWIPDVLSLGRSVTLWVQPQLLRLLQQGLAWLGTDLEVRSRNENGGIEHRALTECHGSILSLPWRLRLPYPPWPSRGGGGYLHLNPAIQPANLGAKPRIGVLWGSGRYVDGHLAERDYRRKSVLGQPLRALLEALAARPLDLWSLQVGHDRDVPEQAQVRWAGRINPDADFLDLAVVLQSLDLVICVDTAAAHLAGALGLEAWVLLPWAAASRWGRGSATTIWYPSLRLWRQPRHRDWLGLWPLLLGQLDQWLATNRWKRVS